MATEIWFGKFKGHEMRVLYQASWKWRWLLKNCERWRDDLEDIERRYLIWKSRQAPRRQLGPAAQRAAPNIVHPVGERLDCRDDGAASDAGESYISDDGFVVPDSQYDGDDSYVDDEDYQGLLDDGSDDDDLASERATMNGSQDLIDEDEGQDATPLPLGEVVNSSSKPDKHRLIDTESDMSEGCKPAAHGTLQKRRRVTIVLSDSEN